MKKKGTHLSEHGFTKECRMAKESGEFSRNSRHSNTFTLWKLWKFTLTEKIFRQITYSIISSVQMLLSRTFCQERVKVNFRNFHTVSKSLKIFFYDYSSASKFCILFTPILQKMISRKIWVTEKSRNFRTIATMLRFYQFMWKPLWWTVWKLRKFTFTLFYVFIFTVWKFHDFSMTQILREIKFGDSRSAKSWAAEKVLKSHPKRGSDT